MDSGLDRDRDDNMTTVDAPARPGHAQPVDASPYGYDHELRADVRWRLGRAIGHMEQFLQREDACRQGAPDPTWALGARLAVEARSLLTGALGCDEPTVRESTLRTAYRLTGALAGLAAWTAPATQESRALNSFPLAAARDVVAYARYGCPDIAAQELAYASMLGFDAVKARLLLTSSGMAAYALIENFLLRDVLAPGDRVLLHPGVYFETQLQVTALKFLEVTTAAGGGRADMLRSIAALEPKVVFVDPLTNTMEFRAIDMLRLLDEADRVCGSETWFVIDGTLLSGGFDPFAGEPRRHVRVLYYESGCKYLQFGMDLGPAGVVVVDTARAERLLQLRRGTGAIASEALVLPRASRAAYLEYLCLQTQCAVAVAAAVNGFAGGGGDGGAGRRIIEAVHPSLAAHPDRAEVGDYPHRGGVLVFRFANDRFNRRAPLEAFIDALMVRAVVEEVPLTAGVSFGFRVARIGAAWASHDADRAFLRLSAGVDTQRAADLGRLIAGCAAEFAAADAGPA